MLQEIIVLLFLEIEIFDALFANDQSFGRAIDLLFDGFRGLPALQSLGLILKLSCLRPHALDMHEVCLEVLYNISLLCLRFLLQLLNLLLQLFFCQFLFHTLSYHLLLNLNFLSVFKQFLNHLEFIISLNHKLLIFYFSVCFCFLEHVQCEAAREMWANILSARTRDSGSLTYQVSPMVWTLRARRSLLLS